MNKGKVALFILAAIVVIGVGMFFLRAPQPNIVLAPEVIFSIGGFDVVNTLITSIGITVILVTISFLATRNMKMIPSGLQNAVEAGVDGFYSLVKNVAGEDRAR